LVCRINEAGFVIDKIAFDRGGGQLRQDSLSTLHNTAKAMSPRDADGKW